MTGIDEEWEAAMTADLRIPMRRIEKRRRHCHIIGNCMRWTFHVAISCRGDDFVPCLHRRGPKGSVRPCRSEMTLDNLIYA